MTTPMPEWLAAFVAYLQADDGVTAICATDAIRQEPPQGSGAPTYAIGLQRAGGFGTRVYTPELQARLDIRCYGPTAYESMRLWRTVQAALEGDRQRNGFTAAGCRVKDIHLISAPVDGLTDAGWPLSLATYELLVSEAAVV